MKTPTALASPSKGYVLIVDDEEQNRSLLRDPLEARGYEIAEAENGLSAMQMVSQRLPDVILLDVMMPKISGFEVCKRIRANPETRDIIIHMITALDQHHDIDRAVEVGTNDFLTKPINKTELLLRIKAALASRQYKDPLEQTLAYIEGVQAAV